MSILTKQRCYGALVVSKMIFVVVVVDDIFVAWKKDGFPPSFGLSKPQVFFWGMVAFEKGSIG